MEAILRRSGFNSKTAVLPCDVDGPYLDDMSGEYHVVEVFFESKMDAQRWMHKTLREMDEAEPTRKKGFLSRIFGQ